MTNFTKLAIASFLTATVSTAALAQTAPSVDTDAEVGAQVETQGTGVGAGASTGVGAAATTGTGAAAGSQAGMQADQMNYGQVISSLRSGDAEANVDALAEAESAQIITLSELRGNAAEQAGALDEALSDNEDRVEDFRSAIEGNDALKEALEARGFEADDVVAITTDASGEVTLVVDA